ncbi:MAG: OB-fold domain-containing protein [Proteobacteria bacterium]|nr:OB-fold domain-containing protein [Pseudomonadota bacterium]
MNDIYSESPAKPRPQIALENQSYWDGLRRHQLLVQRCLTCAKLRHYPRPMCDACYSFEYDWHALSGSATVHSWTVTHHAFHAGFKQDLPYVTVTADLRDGIRLQAPLAGSDVNLAVGARLDLEFIDVDAELTIISMRIRA